MSATLRAKLTKLESPPKAATARTGGLLVLPPILPLNKWEALAVAQQAALAVATHEGVDDAPTVRIG